MASEPVLTGRGALALTVTGEPSATVGLSQTMVLTNAWDPGLSFWYRPLDPGTGDRFRVTLTLVTETISTTLPVSGTITPTLPVTLSMSVSEPVTITPPVTEPITITVRVTTTHVLTPALDQGGWHHLWQAAGPPESFLTGTVSVLFELWSEGQGTTSGVYVDQVSLGATPGGPYKVYLPAINKLW